MENGLQSKKKVKNQKYWNIRKKNIDTIWV